MELLFVICLCLSAIIIVLAFQYRSYRVRSERQNKRLHDKLMNAKHKNNQLEKSLQKEQGIIQLIQKHMTESILILDDSDKIMLANDSAIDLLQIDKNLIETHSIFTLISNSTFLDALRMTKKDGSASQLISTDSQDYRAFIQRVALSDCNGTIILLINVTDAVKAEKIRREFTANVSHELKTPLTVIEGFGEMFGSGMISDPESVQKYGAMIEHESQRLLFLMNDIIRLSEIEEHIEQQVQCVDLYDTANAALKLLSDKAEQNQIRLIAEVDKLCITGNENYIQELFTNLIDNAIKYNNPGGYVKVIVRSENDNAVIEVIDNGIGIPKPAQSRIFERFYRVDKSRSKEKGGTGLGLSIVKHIVEYHKGTISLESIVGCGTLIKVELPCLCVLYT